MQSVPSINYLAKLKTGLLLLLFFIPLLSFSQVTASELKKLSPPLQKQWKEKPVNQVAAFMIAVNDPASFRTRIEKSLPIKLIYEYEPAGVFLIKTSWKEILQSILPLAEVLFIDVQRTAKEELAVSDLDLSTDKVNLVHARFPQYNGNNIVVSVKENRPDTADIDFQGRYLSTLLSSNTFSTHATNMATIVGGGGNTYYEGKGVAWGSTLSSSSFVVLLPEPDAAYQQYNITVQNHSYGTSIENYYGADAAAYDASVITRPSLMHIFSAGNSGAQTSVTGPYANVPGFANITGSFKMAKNIITVGHIDSLGIVLAPSSKGPAYDGRIKPELVAFAEDGSSGAAAIVSGITALLQQAYKDLHGSMPSSALLKTILLNSADDVGSKGIDYSSGYGAANAYKAMLCVVNTFHFNNSVGNGTTNVHSLSVPPNLKQLKITLAWNDPAAAANASKALRNDLDIELTLPATGQLWLPWVLSHFPNADSLRSLPLRKKDSLNNVEQITIDNPAAGNYQVNVKGFSVTASSPQSYFIAYQFDTLDKFKWYYPTMQDNIFGGRANVLRWESTYGNSTALLEYSLDNGTSWQLIDNAVDLTRGYYKWTPPDTFATSMLRMNFASQNFRSDTFTISKRIDVFVGFNCADSFMLYWNKVPGVTNYLVYQLGDKYMESFRTTPDTAVILSKQADTTLFYAIAPLINNKTGVRSYGYNYTTQGVACYIRSFLAQLIGKTGKLDLELGTNYNIKTITWQKLTTNGYVNLQITNLLTGVHFSYTDSLLVHGLNIYRARIELFDGRVIYTDPETVFFSRDPYIIYPNPAPQSAELTIVGSDPENTELQVFNSLGSMVYKKLLKDWVNTIPTRTFSKGIYFLRFLKASQVRKTLKLVVY